MKRDIKDKDLEKVSGGREYCCPDGSPLIISRVPLTSWNSLYVKPGQSAQTFTPVCVFSSASASLNLIRNDLLAP